MLPTNRSIIFMLFAAPLLVLATWFPALKWVAWGYAGLMVVLIVVDWRLAGKPPAVDVHRKHDTKLSLGIDNPISLSVSNRTRRPVAFLLRDEPPEAFTIEKRIQTGRAEARATWEGIYHVRPLRRGDYRFGNMTLRCLGPLGLVHRQSRIQAEGPVKVYPNLLDVKRYDLLLRRNRLQEMGLRNSRRFGEGTDFERLREYLPDDEYRRINWKATARRGSPVTTEYQTERSQNVIAVLDAGRMMQSPVEEIAKLDYVINAVLFLTYVASGKGDQVGMLSFADDVSHYLSPRHGRGQFYRMLEVLYALEPQPVEPDYQRALTYLALKQRRRSLIVIFTDLGSGISTNSLVGQVSMLSSNSLSLVVTISDPDVHAAAHLQPANSLQAYQRSAAMQLLDERQIMLDTLRKRGVLTLDVPANQLSTEVINRYLELKGRTLL
jgi:uncharacterized protein (DUF58 family)